MRRIIVLLLSLAAIVLLSAPASAMQYGNFQITFGSAGTAPTYDPALNDGWEDGGQTWFYYDDDGNWWNQWWYNHPFDPTRYKIVEVGLICTFTDPNGWLDITINWSNPTWTVEPNPGRPPLPGEGHVERLDPWHLDTQGGVALGQEFFIPTMRLPVPYNPEWVSIDFWGENVEITAGVIGHDCVVPVPAAVWLLGSGLIGLIGLRKKMKI